MSGTNYNSSDLTARLKARTEFADLTQRRTAVAGRYTVRADIETGDAAANASSTYTETRYGAVYTTPAEFNLLTGTATPQAGTTQVVQTFTTTGAQTWIAPAGTTAIEYLLVGGGGGGGGAFDMGAGGGGGGGQAIIGSVEVIPLTAYTITVGAGGVAGTPVYGSGTNEVSGTGGGSSSFASITAGGGSGGFASRVQTGGSGIGGAAAFGTAGGGAGRGGGGGGGGDLGDGGSASGATAGPGGAGLITNFSGSSVTYGTGGNGANGAVNNNGSASAANIGKGGDGGGSGAGRNFYGRDGGSGVVVLKYKKYV
jgi:hypothetical protein